MAISPIASVTEGRNRLRRLSPRPSEIGIHPVTGKICHFTARKYDRTSASTNGGMAIISELNAAQHLVERLALPAGRQQADRDAQRHRHQLGQDHQLDRHREAGLDRVPAPGDWSAVTSRGHPWATSATHVRVPRGVVLVEVELGVDAGDLLGRRAVAQDGVRDAARHVVDHHHRGERHDEDHEREMDHASADRRKHDCLIPFALSAVLRRPIGVTNGTSGPPDIPTEARQGYAIRATPVPERQ